MIATIALLSVLGCSDSTSAQDGPDESWNPPDQRGPYDVGLTTFEFIDPRGKELTVDVWYPAAAAAQDELAQYSPLALSITALREPAPALRRAPLLAFSHGFGAIRFQSAYMMEQLASHGYVIVSPDHTHNTFMDFKDEETANVMFERPDDVRYSIDEVLRLSEGNDPLWSQLVDGAQYAALGHSFGSHTAMTLGGAELDYDGLVEHCTVNPGTRACQYLAEINPEDALSHGAADERVVLTVPMSPGLWYTFGAEGEGLAHSRPALLMAGTLDEVLDYEPEALPTFEAFSSPIRLATFAGAGHYGFTDMCTLASFLTPECDAITNDNGDPYASMVDIRMHSNTLVTAFLGARYLMDERYEPWLENSHWEDSLVSISVR